MVYQQVDAYDKYCFLTTVTSWKYLKLRHIGCLDINVEQ
jgi:hypothetical protein